MLRASWDATTNAIMFRRYKALSSWISHLQVEELDANEYTSTRLLKNYVNKEWNIPEHLQMLMCNGQEIGQFDDDSFHDIFLVM